MAPTDLHTLLEHYFPRVPASPPAQLNKVTVALHLNEMPVDIPLEIKKRVSERLEEAHWNRYPPPFGQTVIPDLAEYLGVETSHILLAPGSSALIRLLFSFFSQKCTGKIIVTRPSFSYYEQYCQTFGVPYETWDLTSDFEYDLAALDNLPGYSVVFLTTPNNPTGNVIAQKDLADLLEKNLTSLFIVDEAYGEFAEESMIPLINHHENILILRTFSKSFAAAGIRFGYAVGNAGLIQAVCSLQTPWQLTPFTLIAAQEILRSAKKISFFSETLSKVIEQRNQMVTACTTLLKTNNTMCTVFSSQANFFLLRFQDTQAHNAVVTACSEAGILIKDLSHEPALERCIRISIGTPEENQLFLQTFEKSLKA